MDTMQAAKYAGAGLAGIIVGAAAASGGSPDTKTVTAKAEVRTEVKTETVTRTVRRKPSQAQVQEAARRQVQRQAQRTAAHTETYSGDGGKKLPPIKVAEDATSPSRPPTRCGLASSRTRAGSGSCCRSPRRTTGRRRVRR
jgi:hypothetical protein